MIAKPNFHNRSIFSGNLIAIELRKLEVKFNKPIYVGMSILNISKICLYEFHHEYMLQMHRDKCKIMYTDTDSLIYYFECDVIISHVRCNNIAFHNIVHAFSVNSKLCVEFNVFAEPCGLSEL